jgi:hypothetical protein
MLLMRWMLSTNFYLRLPNLARHNHSSIRIRSTTYSSTALVIQVMTSVSFGIRPAQTTFSLMTNPGVAQGAQPDSFIWDIMFPIIPFIIPEFPT